MVEVEISEFNPFEKEENKRKKIELPENLTRNNKEKNR